MDARINKLPNEARSVLKVWLESCNDLLMAEDELRNMERDGILSSDKICIALRLVQQYHKEQIARLTRCIMRRGEKP